MSSLEAVVRRLRRSSARASAVQYLLHALLAAGAWILGVVILARFVPLEKAVRVAALGVPAAFAVVAVAWVATRPSPINLMRTADLRLGLKERLSTAWERRLEAGPVGGPLPRDAPQEAAPAQPPAPDPGRPRPPQAL